MLNTSVRYTSSNTVGGPSMDAENVDIFHLLTLIMFITSIVFDRLCSSSSVVSTPTRNKMDAR